MDYQPVMDYLKPKYIWDSNNYSFASEYYINNFLSITMIFPAYYLTHNWGIEMDSYQKKIFLMKILFLQWSFQIYLA